MRRTLPGLLALAALACAPAQAQDAWNTLQPSTYVQLSFGGTRGAAPAAHPDLRWGLRWTYDAAALRQREDLPPLLQLEFSAARTFSAGLLGQSLVAHTPRLGQNGEEGGGWRWSRGMTWLTIGVAATAAVALSLDNAEENAEEEERRESARCTINVSSGSVSNPDQCVLSSNDG